MPQRVNKRLFAVPHPVAATIINRNTNRWSGCLYMLFCLARFDTHACSRRARMASVQSSCATCPAPRCPQSVVDLSLHSFLALATASS
jgi:hypothetical protein